jgi:chromosome partitioning protein
MAIITFAQTKGGSGKTTSAMATIAELVARGETVAAIDLDPNKPLARYLSRIPELASVPVRSLQPDKRVIALVKELHKSYNHVIIDLMGAATNDTQVAMSVADLIIIPSQMSSGDLQCALDTFQQASEATEISGRPIACAVLMTRTSAGAVRPRVEEHTKQQYLDAGIPVFAAAFGDRAVWKEMTYAAFVPHLHDRDGNAALNFIAIFDEMMERISAAKSTKPERKSA